MLNKPSITKTTYLNPNQILANVELQASVGCIVKQTDGVTVGSSKIVKAGTPLKIDFTNLQTAATKADANTNAMNAILLHDVDVTAGNANGAALVFGFVNFNRIDSATQSLLTTAQGNAAASKLITVLKV